MGEQDVVVLFCGHDFDAGFHYTAEALRSEPRIRVVRCDRNDCRATRAETPSIMVEGEPLTFADALKTASVAIPLMSKFGELELSQSFSPSLKLILQFGVGLEGVDIRAASRRGLPVANIPSKLLPPLPYAHLQAAADDDVAAPRADGEAQDELLSSNANAASCAELAIFLVLSLAKKLRESALSVQNRRLGKPVGDTLLGSRILVVGAVQPAVLAWSPWICSAALRFSACRLRRHRAGAYAAVEALPPEEACGC